MDSSITPDPDDPELLADFRRMIDQVGKTECPCGWSGTGPEMRVEKARFTWELFCPRCGTALRGLEINY